MHDRRDGCQYQPNEQPKSEMHLPAMQRDGKDEINHQAKVSTEMKTENNTSQNKEDSNGNSVISVTLCICNNNPLINT